MKAISVLVLLGGLAASAPSGAMTVLPPSPPQDQTLYHAVSDLVPSHAQLRGAIFGGNANIGYNNSGQGNIGAFNGNGNANGTSGNNNIGAFNGNLNAGQNNGNGNIGAGNGNLNSGNNNGNGNIGGVNGNFNGGSFNGNGNRGFGNGNFNGNP